MTACALAAGLESKPAMWCLGRKMKSSVTLQAQLSAFASNQEHPVGRSMRAVTGDASFDLCRRMLVNERTSLIKMALPAGFSGRLDQARWVKRAVSVVAVRAFHQALGHSMMHRLRKLCSHRSMAGVAKIRLRSLDQATLKPS